MAGKLKLAIPIGDPAGIGPEIVLKSVFTPEFQAAAEAIDRQDFVVRLEELAEPWGVILSQVSRGRVRNLTSLVKSKERRTHDIPRRPVPRVRRGRRSRARPTWWKKISRYLDPLLVVALGLLLFGLFFLAVFGGN